MRRVQEHSDRLASAIDATEIVLPPTGEDIRVGLALRQRRLWVEVLAAVLETSGEESYGYELARICGTPTGSVYKVLDALLADGLLTSRPEDPEVAAANRRQPRVFYRLTDAGERALGAWRTLELRRSPASRLIT
jgi:DNA-binding PadR family transcriptional regulator